MTKIVRYTRRTLVKLLGSVSLFAALPLSGLAKSTPKIYLGMGGRAGEVTATTAIIQARLTLTDHQDSEKLIPGIEGQARIIYGMTPGLESAHTSGWFEAVEDKDYSVQVPISDLKSASRYHYRVEMRSGEEGEVFTSKTHSFKTAPAVSDDAPVHFQVTSCQTFDNGPAYLVMRDQNPDFLVSTGDNVYYDKHRFSWMARTPKEAYNAYQRMYGNPALIRYFDDTGCYFMKDDHDYRFNDADAAQVGYWVSEKWYDPTRAKITATRKNRWYDEAWLTHEEGIEVVRNVFPASAKNYRTFRWGKGVQIWMLEGRDYRTANDMKDGPEKSIWGAEQKAWLKSTLVASDAKFRIIISPTPMVGPDKPGKSDNHVNKKGFYHEGQDFLNFLIDQDMTDNTFILCGDRHWQYHSTYKGKVHEFCSSVPGPDNLLKPTTRDTDHVVRDYLAEKAGYLTVRYQPGGALSICICGIDGAPMFELPFNT